MDNNLQGTELFIVFVLIGIVISAITWWTLTTRFKYAFIGKEGSFIIACLAIGLIFGTLPLQTTTTELTQTTSLVKNMKFRRWSIIMGQGAFTIFMLILHKIEKG